MRSKSPFKVIGDGLLAWLSGWISWVPVCFAWVLCWATIILGPPATFALAQGAHYAVLGIFPSWGELVRFGRQYFWLSWAWMLLNLAFFALIGAPYYLAVGSLAALKWVTIILAGLWLVMQFFTLPYIMIAERKNLFSGLKDAVRTVYYAPGYALTTAGASLLIGIICLILVAPVFMGGAALVAVLGSQAAVDRPKQIPLTDRIND